MKGRRVKIRLADGSGTADLKFLVEDVDRHGRVRIYFRRKGARKIVLKSAPGSPEFFAEYRQAMAGTHPGTKTKPKSSAPQGSLRALIEAYYESSDFTTLADSTQIARRRVLDAICLEPLSKDDPTPISHLPACTLPPSAVRILRERKAATPQAANIRVKALRRVYSWGIEAEKVSTNPARDIKRIKGRKGGHHTWTIDEVRQFIKRHPLGTKPHLALAILLFSGVRRSDAVRLGRQCEKGETLRFTPYKTRRQKPGLITIPILPILRRTIAATPSGNMTYLVTAYGKPFSIAGFGMRFREWCDQAGLPHCSAHGLRKAGAVMLTEMGATPHQLKAIYGWESLDEVELYTKGARQALLAAQAMPLLESGTNVEGVQPFDGDYPRLDKNAS